MFSNKSSFVKGVVVGLCLTSIWSFATGIVSLNIFSPGQVISAQDVNDNFAYLEAKINGSKITLDSSVVIDETGFTANPNFIAEGNNIINLQSYDYYSGNTGDDYYAHVYSFQVPKTGIYYVNLGIGGTAPASLSNYSGSTMGTVWFKFELFKNDTPPTMYSEYMMPMIENELNYYEGNKTNPAGGTPNFFQSLEQGKTYYIMIQTQISSAVTTFDFTLDGTWLKIKEM